MSDEKEEKETFEGDEGTEKKMEFDWMPAGCIPLADGEYDAIILGTGLTECIISGLLSVQGKRVLHMDRNNFYGADTASLSLSNLFQKFRPGTEPAAALGHSRHWNVDLVPKFIMGCGNLVKILLHTKVTRYLEFKSIHGSYVFKDKKIQKVPASASEAMSSSLLGFFAIRSLRNFLQFVQNYEKDKPATYLKGKSMDRVTTKALFDEYSLDQPTRDMIGHALALHTDESYLSEPAEATVDAIKLYYNSFLTYGKTPYLYPLYGLGGLPEGFSRLCAIHGGTFMLNKGVDEILFEGGKAWGVKTGNEVAKASMIIGDPSYFDGLDKLRVSGKIIRTICILDHPIPGTDNAESVQMIIPSNQVGRSHDIYVCMVSAAHQVAAPGMYIAIVSTTVETASPEREIEPGIALLGRILERFDSVTDLYEPVYSGQEDGCFISKSYDATSHFETAAVDVLSLYQRITGSELDLTISADLNAEEEG